MGVKVLASHFHKRLVSLPNHFYKRISNARRGYNTLPAEDLYRCRFIKMMLYPELGLKSAMARQDRQSWLWGVILKFKILSGYQSHAAPIASVDLLKDPILLNVSHA
jgi:hypothetical protein